MAANATIVDLFCGAGGFALGVAQAGFRPLMGIDIDSNLVSQ
jgi:DNA (cytosine-5)-methyltransferase 1